MASKYLRNGDFIRAIQSTSNMKPKPPHNRNGVKTNTKEFHRVVTHQDIEIFKRKIQTIMPSNYGAVTSTGGKRFAKIISGGGSAWGFVEISTGDLYKPMNWGTPAKHSRGNIFDPDIMSQIDWTGPRYLK